MVRERDIYIYIFKQWEYQNIIGLSSLISETEECVAKNGLVNETHNNYWLVGSPEYWCTPGILNMGNILAK